MEALGETLGLTKGTKMLNKFYGYFALKALVCFAGFIVSALVLQSESLTLFWVAILSTIASLGFYFVGE
jgi:hypothetical protein